MVQAGGDGLRIERQPNAGVAEPRQIAGPFEMDYEK
jgi:hypothetical protein